MSKGKGEKLRAARSLLLGVMAARPGTGVVVPAHPLPRARAHAIAQVSADETPGQLAARVREARVRSVMGEMASGKWRTGASHARHEAAWGVHLDTVKSIAGEAARRLRSLAGDHETEIVGRMLSEIEQIGGLALDATKATNDGTPYAAPDYRAALAAIELRAKLLGLLVQNVKVTEVTALPDDELRKQYDAMRARVLAEEERRRKGDG